MLGISASPPAATGLAARRRAGRFWLLTLGTVIALGVGAATPRAVAHVIMGTPSLHLRVAEADLIVRGRVVDPSARYVSSDEKMMRELVEIEVLETLKGLVDRGAAEESSADSVRIRFAQDGHEAARYREGEEALFFLGPIAESRELKALAVKGGATHVSSQEHDETFVVAGEMGALLLSATRAFVASENTTTSKESVALIRGATLKLLTSRDPQLGSMALASLVLAPHAALVTKRDVPLLEGLLVDASASIGFRAGLLAELERRGLVDGPAHWLKLIEAAGPSELGSAIRAAGANPSPEVAGFLIQTLEDSGAPDEIRAEAAIALGNARGPSAVPALENALNHESKRIRNAAIRGLGQQNSSDARAVLTRAAEAHSDPAMRRRAAGQMRRWDGADR